MNADNIKYARGNIRDGTIPKNITRNSENMIYIPK